MKKRLIIFLAFSILFSVISPSIFAGIPIDGNTLKKQVEQATLVKKKSTKRFSKLKQKIVQKIIIKDIEDGESNMAAFVFAILIPFVGVAIYQDRIGKDFWITLALTILGFIPGMIYALSIILKRLK